MTGLNNIYVFAEDATNILNNEDYSESSTLETGILAGSLARSELHNKIFKQSTICASGLSQFIADNQDEDIDDSMTNVEYAAALTEAIDSRVSAGIGDIVTQPQFDNEAVAATDEFVNRALGSYSFHKSVSSTSTTLTGADVGCVITYNPSPNANGTWVLPDYTGFRLGSTVEIINGVSNTSILTVSPADGQNLINTTNVGLSEIDLAFGDNAIFTLVEISSTLYWMLTGGTVALQYSATFGLSKASSGYCHLPGGLIMQWGIATVLNTGNDEGFVSVTFPISFQTGCYIVVANANNTQTIGNAVNPIIISYNYTTTGCTLRSDSNNFVEMNRDIQISWFAIGS